MMMIKKIPFVPNICYVSQDQSIPIASDFKSNKQLVEQMEQLSILLIAEYYRTITFTSIQVSNTFRSAGYFYPSINKRAPKEIKAMVAEVNRNLDYFNKEVLKIFNSNFFGKEKKHAVHETSDTNDIQVYAAVLAERMRINEFGNNFRFFYLKNTIHELGKFTRNQIGKIVLKYQENHFINPIKKEVYHV
jgi:hypothetical protein